MINIIITLVWRRRDSVCHMGPGTPIYSSRYC